MSSWKITDTPSGHKSLVYTAGRDVRIHSAFDPVKEAERSVEGFDPGKKNIIAILGTGLGYHAALLARKFPDKRIVAIDRYAEVIDLARRHTPININACITVSSADDLSKVFEEMDITAFRGFAPFIYRPSYVLDPQFYDHILTEMNRYASSKISDLLTRFEFEEKWAENIIANIPLLPRACRVAPFFGAFANIPGIIVSAGPSLKKNAHLLASLKDKALICCVDTSFKVLSRMGIEPHIVMTLDAQKHSIRHFLGIRDSSPLLLADMVSYPKIAHRYKGKVVLSTTSKYYNTESGAVKRETTPLMDWVEDFFPEIGDIQSGGSVATSLFDFMLNAGCNPVILLGQDLAYTGREIHTSGTYHNDEWLTLTDRRYNLDTINQRVIRKRKIKYVPAWGGGEVITDYVLDLYRSWFEDSFTKVPLTVINASEGGAHIEGAKEERFADICARLKPLKKNPGMIIETILSDAKPCSAELFLKGLDTALPVLEKLSKIPADSGNEVRSALAEIHDSSFEKLLAPYLKKTNAYLNRHPDMDKEKSDVLLAGDIVRASKNLFTLLTKCREELRLTSSVK